MHDLIIIGGGPAGMTAAVYAGRKKVKALLLSKDLGGQPNASSGIENYMGYQFIEGPELMQKFEKQLKQFPIDVEIGDGVETVSRTSSGFAVKTDSGKTYEAKAVIVATGKSPRLLNVPGETKFRGKGVTYCATCDGPIFSGMNVAVIGGGNSALEAAADMVKIATHVYLVSLTSLTGDPVLSEKLKKAKNATIFTKHEVVEIKGNGLVSGIKIRDLKNKKTRLLEVSGVFVEIGLTPNSEAAKKLVSLNKLGEIEINCSGETEVEGLFAAGDVTNIPEKQIVVAAGEGAKAALRAYRYLQRLK